LQAAERLSYSHSGMRFLIAGGGPDYAKLRNYAQEKRLANVAFTGPLTYHQLTHLLAQCDIGINAISSGSTISLPNKLFDYLAAGLPIISSVKGELENLIKAEHVGLQYEAGNAESLAEAIVEPHNNTQERLAAGQRAKKLAEDKFDMNKEYPKYEEFIRDIAPTAAHNL